MSTTATEAPTGRHRAPFFVEFYRSAVGKKWVMAITGLVLIGFVIAHMVGNLKIWLGPEAGGIYEIDEYGHTLRELFYPVLPRHVALWIMRGGLIAAFALHIHAATTLTFMNRRARIVDYQGPRQYLAANYASRTMRWSGYIVLAYLAFHLADFSWGISPAAPSEWVRASIHANFIHSFSRWPVTAFYVIANLLLGIHLFHGIWSMFQSLGVNNPRFNKWRRWLAQGLSALIVLGNISMPLGVAFGLIN
ncbi:MAG TPA: succinate dehydrogenase cytochrome b subunit [Acidimicrobiia bacterium]|nr:succinate dehydrogenase cytochrome b subunit [Acidimicrobiia bacterium]